MNPDDILQGTTFEDTEKESTTTIKESVILGDDATEHLSDAELAICLHTLSIESSKCQMLYPMPLRCLVELLRRPNSKVLKKIITKHISCIIPLNIGQDWVTILINGKTKTIHYIDSLGNGLPNDLKDQLQCRFISWSIKDEKIRLQAHSYQCGVWVL